jgi:hypothetical protein
MFEFGHLSTLTHIIIIIINVALRRRRIKLFSKRGTNRGRKETNNVKNEKMTGKRPECRLYLGARR